MRARTTKGEAIEVDAARRPRRHRTGRDRSVGSTRPSKRRRNQLLQKAAAGVPLSPMELAELTGMKVRTVRVALAKPIVDDGLLDAAEVEELLSSPVRDADGHPTGRTYGDNPAVRAWAAAHRRPATSNR